MQSKEIGSFLFSPDFSQVMSGEATLETVHTFFPDYANRYAPG